MSDFYDFFLPPHHITTRLGPITTHRLPLPPYVPPPPTTFSTQYMTILTHQTGNASSPHFSNPTPFIQPYLHDCLVLPLLSVCLSVPHACYSYLMTFFLLASLHRYTNSNSNCSANIHYYTQTAILHYITLPCPCVSIWEQRRTRARPLSCKSIFKLSPYRCQTDAQIPRDAVQLLVQSLL